MTHAPFNLAARRPRGFSLIELLVAMSIIVLMLGLALPAFRAITGSRSEEGAANQVASMLGRARADAVGLQVPRGVAFYTDATGQCRLAEVGQVAFPAWADDLTPYAKGAGVSVTTKATPPSTSYYVCIKAVPANVGAAADLPTAATSWADTPYWHVFKFANNTPFSPVPTGTDAPADAYYASDPYLASAGLFYDQLPDTDPVPLPLGVAAQVIADDGGSRATKNNPTDGYLHNGLLLFDASGRLVYQSFVLSRYALLGSAIGLTNASTAAALNVAVNAATSPPLPKTSDGTLYAAGQPLSSSFGLVLYDRDAHDNQNFPAHDPTLDPSVTYGTVNASPPSAADEEQWLDVNATPLLINRYNGTLLRGQ